MSQQLTGAQIGLPAFCLQSLGMRGGVDPGEGKICGCCIITSWGTPGGIVNPSVEGGVCLGSMVADLPPTLTPSVQQLLFRLRMEVELSLVQAGRPESRA